MALLDAVQNVAREAGFAVPGSVVGNSDDTAQLIFALANRAGKLLARRAWQVLQKEQTFSLVAAQETYAVATDLGRYCDYTIWDSTQYWSMRGSLRGQEWQAYKNGLVSSTPRQKFRIRGNLIYIYPTPSDTDSIVVEYISKYWVAVTAAPTVGVTATFVNDTDVCLFDQDALEMDTLWRFLERKGLAYEEAKGQADEYIQELYGNDTPKDPVDMGGDYMPTWPPLPMVPNTGYGP
jgi:hypothetical protein